MVESSLLIAVLVERGPLIVAVLVLSAVGLTLWPHLMGRSPRQAVRNRLVLPDAKHPAQQDKPLASSETDRPAQVSRVRRSAPEAGADDADMRALKLKLVRAGIFDDRAVSWFFAARIVSAMAGAGATALVVFWLMPMQNTLQAASLLIPGCGLGYMLPGRAVGVLTSKLLDEYRSGFPDFMDLMVVCADAGLSLEAAMERIAEDLTEAYPTLSMNLKLACAELRVGRPLEETLLSLGDRLGLEEVAQFATLLQQSRELGSSITEALRVYSDDMRHKRMSVAEEKAYALPAKLAIPVTMCILPTIMIIALWPAVVRMQNMFF
ncbi:MAG: type II secretion system F family protein [Pseudomonadota bacterium]